MQSGIYDESLHQSEMAGVGGPAFAFSDQGLVDQLNAFSAAIERQFAAHRDDLAQTNARLDQTQQVLTDTVAAGVQTLQGMADQQVAEGQALRTGVQGLFLQMSVEAQAKFREHEKHFLGVRQELDDFVAAVRREGLGGGQQLLQLPQPQQQ